MYIVNFSMLLVNNNRSKAYLQNLIKNNFVPKKIILLNDENVTLVEHTENDKIIAKDTKQKFVRKSNDLNISFDEKEHILKTIENNNIEFVLINNLDVNSKEVIDEVSSVEEEYIVYSGPSGTILHTKILSKEKSFIHVHPGLLPKYRGSTTIYYSMLFESKIGCSVMILEKELGEGPVLYRKEYIISEKGVDFDYLLDPLVRAKTLIEFFKTQLIKPMKQKSEESKSMFYIIHPLLKHISIIDYNKTP